LTKLSEINFNEVYESSEDPWMIGDATSSRFDKYLEIFKKYVDKSMVCIDVGCGNGAFTYRLSCSVKEMHAFDISHKAISFALQQYSNSNTFYYVLSAESIRELKICSDVLFCSDTLYYLTENEIDIFFKHLPSVLQKNAICFFSAWCPGGEYFTEQEFKKIVQKNIEIIECVYLKSEYVSMGSYVMIVGRLL